MIEFILGASVIVVGALIITLIILGVVSVWYYLYDNYWSEVVFCVVGIVGVFMFVTASHFLGSLLISN